MTQAVTFQSFAQTHQGNVRRLNEDSMLSRPESGLWVVADGMGGHSAGDVASQMIVEALASLPHREDVTDAVDEIEDALLHVNQRLRDHSRDKLHGATIGSTVVCLVTRGKTGVVLWVGDSRLYRFRNDQIEQLTQDHSEVQARIDIGILTEEQAENSAIKNILSRAVGAFDELAVDINAFTIDHDDVFLLCSDGLYNELSATDLQEILTNNPFDQLSDKLMQASLNQQARDNISLIVVKAVE